MCSDSCTRYSTDGYCDDGSYGINLVCEAWNDDEGDCSSDPDDDPDWVPEPSLCPGSEDEIGDGWCDAENNNEDCPPMPQDDPTAHQYMHLVNGRKGWKHWHENGTRGSLENQIGRAHV